MQQAGYHHANLLANQMAHDMRDELASQNQELMSLLNQAMSYQGSTAPSVTATNTSTLTPATHQVNATTSDALQLEMLKLLKEISQGLCTTAPPKKTAKKKGRKTPDDATFPCRKKDKYCWTHGACAHGLDSCEDQAPGHKVEATFSNRMGGSNAYCT